MIDERTAAAVAVLVLTLAAGAGAWYVGMGGASALLEPAEHATDETTPRDGTSAGDRPHGQGDDADLPGPEANWSYPTERRYIDEYRYQRPPTWRPEHRMTAEDGSVHAYEVTRYPYADPTPRHLEAAWRLYSDTYEAAREHGWFSFDRARADGYRPYDDVHYMNEEYYFDDAVLDPDRPESLIYYDAGDGDDGTGKVLAGVMYLADGLTAEGEQVAGPLTVWHYHPRYHEQCYASALNNSLRASFDDTACPPGAETRYRGPEMIHVWFVRHPEGPFSTQMLGLPDSALERTGKMSRETFEEYARTSFDAHRDAG